MHPSCVCLRQAICLDLSFRFSARTNASLTQSPAFCGGSRSRVGWNAGLQLIGGTCSGFRGLRATKFCLSGDAVFVKHAREGLPDEVEAERDAVHFPVLVKEMVHNFEGSRLLNYVDCTLGAGGHACAVKNVIEMPHNYHLPLHEASRHARVAVCPRPKGYRLKVLGRRFQCRCISEIPSEGDFLSIEASTSSDGGCIEGEKIVESTSDQRLSQDVHIDLNLPRRRMLVEFTCKVCDSRTQRLINPEAYRRGTVFVQCAGCEAYHQLVDNLNLIQEFDFRKENGSTGN